MRNFSSKARSPRGIAMSELSRIFFLSLLFVVLCGCASSQKTVRGIRGPSTKSSGVETDSGKSFHSLPSSPSSNLVSQGIREFKKNDDELAEWNFEQAITVDPNYGPAYYWLARVKYRQNEFVRSLELLHRAEDLLSSHGAWLSRVQDFRRHIQAQNVTPSLD